MKPHLFLNNPRGEQRKFNAQRAIDPEEVEEKEPAAYRPQKLRLQQAATRYNQALAQRVAARTLVVPEHLDYIKVDFYIVFNDNEPFKTRSRFFNRYGLVPVSFYNFNQSVLFAIRDREKFETFLNLLRQFYESRNNVSPIGTPYAIMTIIHDFQLLETADIVEGAPGDDVILSLVNPADPIRASFRSIYNALRDYLRGLPEGQGEVSAYRIGQNRGHIVIAKEQMAGSDDAIGIEIQIGS